MDIFKKSTSRNIPTFKNLYKADMFLHDLAEMDAIKTRNVEVGVFDGEPVNIRTHFINYKDRK